MLNPRRRSHVKLNERKAGEIKWLIEHRPRLRQVEIGKMYGVGPTIVSDIGTGKRWSDVEPISPEEEGEPLSPPSKVVI
jgi:hypothetical protein